MLKMDIPVVREFLETTEGVTEFISRLKCVRLYSVGDKSILILTPTMAEDGIYLNELLSLQQRAGLPMKATEHKRGRNYVYTLERTETVVHTT